MKYRIFETNQFLKDFDKIDIHQKSRIEIKLRTYIYPQLKDEPHFGQNIKKLVNWEPKTYRYRICNYRLFYEIDDNEKIVNVLTIDSSQSSY